MYQSTVPNCIKRKAQNVMSHKDATILSHYYLFKLTAGSLSANIMYPLQKHDGKVDYHIKTLMLCLPMNEKTRVKNRRKSMTSSIGFRISKILIPTLQLKIYVE